MRTTYMCKTAFRPLSGDFHESRSITYLSTLSPKFAKIPAQKPKILFSAHPRALFHPRRSGLCASAVLSRGVFKGRVADFRLSYLKLAIPKLGVALIV